MTVTGENRRSPIYGWFTEGFDTADLKATKELLKEKSGPGRHTLTKLKIEVHGPATIDRSKVATHLSCSGRLVFLLTAETNYRIRLNEKSHLAAIGRPIDSTEPPEE
jgi:hypothetical protein